MKKIVIIFLALCIFKKIIGLKISLKKKYPNVESGVYQLDNKGRPIKLVDVNYNHIWELPKNGTVNSYTVVKKNGKIKKFSEGTNIIYGTTKRLNLPDVEEIDENTIKEKIENEKKIGNIKNVASISKKTKDIEDEEKKKKRQKKTLPQAMHITAEDLPEETKDEDSREIDMGYELGAMIKDNLESHYEETKTPSNLSNDLIDIKIPVTLEKLLLDDLEERKWISKKIMHDKICLRDYSKICPSVWEQISETQCMSPKNYSGPCSHIMTFEPKTAKEKSVIARDCNVSWSCLNESCGNDERDYSKKCPENWIYSGKCEAPENYAGGCSKSVDFDAFTQNEKEEFSSACKVVWPCKEQSCEKDYSIVCPKGWSYNADKDICNIAEEFKGLISEEDAEIISHMTYQQRAEFSSKYGIGWPCKKECTSGYDIYACPRGWVNLMNSGMCKAPEEYTPLINCPIITHFDYMNAKEKEMFSKKCNVKWLCAENSERDYFKCPINFEYINEGEYKGGCHPNEKYKGPCKGPQKLLSLTLEQKYSFEEVCEAQFRNLEKEDIPQTEHDLSIDPSTIEKILKGADISNKKWITLE
ncbi:CPW-WPC family protein [Plasmodium yoelii]|uniref:CPW-WPC family protein n=1 Tax=Plasmodium yoelii TaxID=5861 RepID=A0A078K873_PLAYE|nr:CPW-WPC family protein [Plasmodium yoelii]CDU18226.1 CPW-WPC family protein, putative [Plasmodium yoelii]VTZ78643.1 CPW-WPC family protein [Plasmodium yoelii]|eukprot:XP_022812297.1 CPW-WPC family protein [Plasmodium yoelii]